MSCITCLRRTKAVLSFSVKKHKELQQEPCGLPQEHSQNHHHAIFKSGCTTALQQSNRKQAAHDIQIHMRWGFTGTKEEKHSERKMKTYQQTVEEFMYKEPQSTNQEVQQMIKEFYVHDHCLVSSSEGSAVTHKAHQKNDFITNLRKDKA